MDKVRSYQDLIVWKRSIAFATEIYRITQDFPKSEIYGLTNQMRRAAVSIPSNIAEGYARRSDAYLKQHLDYSLGSAAELDTQIRIALAVEFLRRDDHDHLQNELEEIRKMLHGLLNRLDQPKTRN